MGQPKLLLPYRGGSLIAAALAPYLASPEIARVVVVLGCRAEEIALALPKHDKLGWVENSRYRLGMASSIRCGARALDASCQAVLLGLGDQPEVPREAVHSVIAAWREARPRPLAIVPTCSGRRGHPTLFDGELLPRLRRLPSAGGARALLHRLGPRVGEVAVTFPGILTDIDTPKEYEQACRIG